MMEGQTRFHMSTCNVVHSAQCITSDRLRSVMSRMKAAICSSVTRQHGVAQKDGYPGPVPPDIFLLVRGTCAPFT